MEKQISHHIQTTSDRLTKKKSNNRKGIGFASFCVALTAFIVKGVSFFLTGPTGLAISMTGGTLWFLGFIFSIVGITQKPREYAMAAFIISIIGAVAFSIIGACVILKVTSLW